VIASRPPDPMRQKLKFDQLFTGALVEVPPPVGVEEGVASFFLPQQLEHPSPSSARTVGMLRERPAKRVTAKAIRRSEVSFMG